MDVSILENEKLEIFKSGLSDKEIALHLTHIYFKALGWEVNISADDFICVFDKIYQSVSLK